MELLGNSFASPGSASSGSRVGPPAWARRLRPSDDATSDKRHLAAPTAGEDAHAGLGTKTQIAVEDRWTANESCTPEVVFLKWIPHERVVEEACKVYLCHLMYPLVARYSQYNGGGPC